MKRLITLSALLLCLNQAQALVALQSISTQEQIPEGYKARPVYAVGNQTVIFFATDSMYVDRARQDLLSQCSGRIVGIATQYARLPRFFHYINEVRMEGICLEPDTSSE